MTFTREDIDRWITELSQECDRSEWQEPFKFGFKMALTSIMIKMDDEPKARRSAGQGPSP